MKSKKRINWTCRLGWLSFFFVFCGAGIIVRLFSLQIIQHDFFVGLAQGQHQVFERIFPQRGTIYFQDKYSEDGLYPVAVNKKFFMLYAVPKKVVKSVGDEERLRDLAQKLGDILQMEKETIFGRLNKSDDPYEPLKRKLSEEEYEKIKALNIEGLYFSDEKQRWYSSSEIASQITGFVGFRGEEITDEKIGRYGAEEYYDYDLSGKLGYFEGEKDSEGRMISFFPGDHVSATDGADLILTIDQNIQFKIQEELAKVLEKFSAEKGSVLVMDPKTGAILGMASLPTFDANNFQLTEDARNFLNPIVQETFEPGSIFKPITMAAGLDTKSVTPQYTYYDSGAIVIGGYSIGNFDGQARGIQTMTQVLEKSLNTGVMHVVDRIGAETFKNYVESFGFGKTTGIDLLGEVSGSIANLHQGRKINFATASFGQGISVTPLQLLRAISAIANGGTMMKPRIAQKIIYTNGQITDFEPEIAGQPISAETASKLSAMLVSVADVGYDKKASIKGYYIAGKTGTAQIPDPKGGYCTDETIHSFVGFAPAFDPKFAVLIKMDRPKGIKFAADSLSPVFKNIAQYLLSYYEIPPTRKE